MKTKLKIKTVTFGQIKNTGNYENKRVEATAEVSPGSNGTKELQALQCFVRKQLGLSCGCPTTCCC